MLVNTELYFALKESGASDDKAQAAAALFASYEARLHKIETLHAEILRWACIVAIGAVATFFAASSIG